MRDEQNSKQKKSHRYRKNGASREQREKTRFEKNQARPKQRFLGIDTQTGLGLGWTRGE
jgi:hypothetical protein